MSTSFHLFWQCRMGEKLAVILCFFLQGLLPWKCKRWDAGVSTASFKHCRIFPVALVFDGMWHVDQ